MFLDSFLLFSSKKQQKPCKKHAGVKGGPALRRGAFAHHKGAGGRLRFAGRLPSTLSLCYRPGVLFPSPFGSSWAALAISPAISC